MSDAKYIVNGLVTRQDTGAGIHGLHVEAWDDDLLCNDCLGSDITNRDGSFSIIFSAADFKEKFEGKPEVYLKVYDRDCRLIYDTGHDKCRCSTDKPLQFNLSLVADTLWWHYSRPISWVRPAETLVPEKVIDEIEEAMELLARSGWMGQTSRNNAVFCSRPPIHVFDQVVQDAWDTLQGDLQAAGRYRDVLETLCADQAGECCCAKDDCYHKIVKSIFRQEWKGKPHKRKRCVCTQKNCKEKEAPCKEDKPEKEVPCPCKESLISVEKATILFAAALHISCGHMKTAKTYLLILLDQLCRFEYLGALHRSAVPALCGDQKALAHFRDLIEFRGVHGPADDWQYPGHSECSLFCCCAICLPFEIEQCLRNVVFAWSQITCYTVTEVKPARACPGDEIVVCGDGFGDVAGQVTFRQKGSLKYGPVVRPGDWCDNKIVVTVPDQAGCGLVPNLPADTVMICDRFLEYRATGCIKSGFEGTSPEILKFTVKGRFDGECLEPGEPLQIRWKTCAADKVSVEIINETNNVVIASQNPADSRGSWNFTATHFTSTTRIRVQLTAEGKCHPAIVEQHISFVFQREPNLAVDGMEITQAIQYYRAAQHLTDPADRGPDNSLRLVTNKTAWVRVYLRSGQDPAFDNGQLTGVDGTLTVERRVGGIWGVVANIPSQNGPVTAEDSYVNYNAERVNINNSLNFVIPENIMTGLLRLRVNVAAEFPECPGNTAVGQIMADVNLTQTLNAAFITIGYNGPNAMSTGNLNLPAPTLAQCQAETGWAMRTYPVSGVANTRIAGTFITNTPLNDPRSCPGCCSPNWQPLLQQVALLVAADQAAFPAGNWVYYGIINNGIPVNVPGCNGWGATGGLAGNQNGITYAHEIGHQFGLPHARCGNAGAGNASYPVYEPYDLPVDPAGTTNWTMASIGEYGLDINNGNIADPNNAEDFMSYCGPRWISVFTYNYLVNEPGLVPQVIPTGSGAATDRVIQDNGGVDFVRSEKEIVPLIHMLGVVNREGQANVTSVTRLETRYLVGNGRPTSYVAQLLNDEGVIIAQDVLYRYESEGCGSGAKHDCCDDCKRDKSFLFKAMLDNVAPGACLRIVKDDEVIWQRNRPSNPPRLSHVRASLTKESQLRLTYRLQKESDVPEDIWVRWSNDDGQTWRAFTVGLTETSTDLDLSQLPSGNILFQVMAHDGFYTVSETTKSIELPARQPTVTIMYPNDDDRVYAERVLHLWGTAESLEAEELTDEQFVWTIDGQEAGRGRDIWVENPGEGLHEVQLVVRDEGGEGYASSSINVV